MRTNPRLRALFALFAAALLTLGIVACGSDSGDSSSSSSSTEASSTDSGSGDVTPIENNPDNNGIKLTIGSKNFTEQFILGEIYAQALEAAGYEIKTDLNLGSEQIALKSLQDGEISAYPEYTSTALTSFFKAKPDQVPGDAQQAYEDSKSDFAKLGLEAFPPTPFSSANAVGMLKSTAGDLGVTKISDLEGKSQDLTLAGSPECRQRIDCLLGLQQNYGLQFKKFTPIDIALRYEVLDKGNADASILFTTDAQLFNNPDKYVLLEDDKGVLPAGNILFIASKDAVDKAGPDFGSTVENVQSGLTLDVMQELNSRVDVDKEKPADVAKQYLQESGYIN